MEFDCDRDRYAAQKQQEKKVIDKQWSEVTVEEMKVFIFIQFMFGMHKLPELSCYWSTDPLQHVSAVADGMSRNRFQKISHYFHLNDNANLNKRGQEGFD